MLCECCLQDSSFEVSYTGKIRNGPIGNYFDGYIERCPHCSVERLPNEFRIEQEDYDSGDYRKLVGEEISIEAFRKKHDCEQPARLQFIYDHSIQLRGKSLLDVGSGGRSFLDHISGIVDHWAGVEPCREYVDIGIYRSLNKVPESFDIVTCFLTLEHVENPLEFLIDCRRLTREVFIMSIPNDESHNLENYYRRQHNWYFDRNSIISVLTKAGFNSFVTVIRHPYRYVIAK